MTHIRIKPHAAGYVVTVLRDGEVQAAEWFKDWRRARSAADTLSEQLAEQGITTEITEVKEPT